MTPYFVYATALASGILLPKSRLITALLVLLSIVFIGLRFETGFDWPAYKEVFQGLKPIDSLGQFFQESREFNQEIAFLAVLAALSKIFGQYELAQFAFTALFVGSLIFLAKALNVQRTALFFTVAISYVLFTLGFSTVRQSVAIALFNISVFLYARDRVALSVFMMVIACSMQYVAIIYVVTFLITAGSTRFQGWRCDVLLAGSILFVGIVGGVVFLALAGQGLTFGSERVQFYIDAISERGVSKWDWAFSLVLLGITAHIAISAMRSERTKEELFTARLALVLAAFATSAIFVPIIRERASYQMWIVYAAFLTYDSTLLRRTATAAALSFAIYFAVAVPFRNPGILMFVPYQNYIPTIFGHKYPDRPYYEFLERYRDVNGGGSAQGNADAS